MTSGMRVVGGVLALAAIVGLGALSQVPYPPEPPAHAVIRLTWRTRSKRVDECRRLTTEEQAQLPAHMRREEVCEGRVLAYRLRVVLDGDTVADETVEPRGARADRPLYVFHEIPAPPGVRVLDVAFVREDSLRGATGGDEGTTGGDERATGGEDSAVREGRAGRVQETPAVLQFSERLELEPRQVALITYDPERRALVLKGYGQTP
ncbi:MAG: hypothetical protein HY337_12175 [Gemmatimonadetes bacterium]|nr:hypothetical protein [Gemmatimonadota bacterium]